MSETQGARIVPNIVSRALTLSSRMHAVVGVAVTHIVPPADATYMVLKVEADGFRIRPGNYVAITEAAGNWTAGTDIVTSTAHGRVTGDGPYHITTSNTLPTGITIDTDYYIIRVNDNSFQLALSQSGAKAGTAVDFSTGGTGNHTIGGMAGVPAATNTLGQENLHLLAENTLLPTLIAAPKNGITVEGSAAGSILVYWFLE